MQIVRCLTTVDTHTAGGPTRLVTGGLPPLRGSTVAARMSYFGQELDHIRRLLVFEPRGHADMYAAVLTEPSADDADVGLFFMTPGGYLRACVHSTIGAITACLETGALAPPGAGGSIRVEVPAGIVHARPQYSDGALRSVAVRTPPAFVHSTVSLSIERSARVDATIAFSGAFFLLVECSGVPADASRGSIIGPGTMWPLRSHALRLLAAADAATVVADRQGARASIGYVMLYERTGEGRTRSLVVARSGAVDRSPCGAGTAALTTALFAGGELAAGEECVNESPLGTQFRARILEAAAVDGRPGAMPEVEGAAYVTGLHSFVLDARDPLREGFHVQEGQA